MNKLYDIVQCDNFIYIQYKKDFMNFCYNLSKESNRKL